MPHEVGRARNLMMAPLLALAIGSGACTHGYRYGPSRPYDAAHDSTTSFTKLDLLWHHFVRQQTMTSCSVASVATVLNAVLAQRHRALVAQPQVLASEPTGSWARATADASAPGVTLDQLGLYTLQAFYAQGIKRVTVDVNHIHDSSDTTVQSVVSVLEKHERFAEDYFVIVNFLQSSYFKDGEAVGHMSVVGAYDLAREQVLILDVDPRDIQPYWISLQKFVAGMQTPDSDTGEPRGYLVIRLG